MLATLVVRAFHPLLEKEECTEASARMVTLLGGGGEARVRLCTYSVKTLLVYEADRENRVAERGWKTRIVKTGPRLCRYHEGPRGDPLRQRWCHAVATHGSWCKRHASSPLALYERCTSSNDLTACKAVDALWRDEEYIVYLLYHGAGLKIGVTRAWRFYTRVLEQPHLGTAVIARLKSALEARKLEKRLAKTRGFSEGIGVPRAYRMRASILSRHPLEDTARRLAEAIARLGLEGEFDAIRIEPKGCPTQPLLNPSNTLAPGVYSYLCMWGGIIVFETEGGYRGVKREAIQHRLLYAEPL